MVLEKTLESPLDWKEIKAVNQKKKKNQSQLFIVRTEAKAEAPILWSPDVKNWLLRCWERLKAGGGDDRGRNGWIASSTQWRWVWASSGSWWWTRKPDTLQSIGWQRVRHNWATELNLPIWILYFYLYFVCLLCLGLIILFWIKVLRLGILSYSRFCRKAFNFSLLSYILAVGLS